MLTVGLLYYGIGYTGYISTLDWDGISPEPPSVGGHNYTRIFHDPVFWAAVRHTVVFFVITFVVRPPSGCCSRRCCTPGRASPPCIR